MFLNKHINDFAILVDSSPQIVLLTVDVYENFINIERISESMMASFESS